MGTVREARMCVQRHWLWFVFVLACLTTTATGVVDVTIVSKYQFFDESADTWLYCYYTGNILKQSNYQFGVEVNTGSGTGFATRRSTGRTTGRWNVRIWADSADFRVGAFSCRVRTPDNNQTEKAITFKMKSQADVWPVTFTVTANTGDPVTLQMVQKSNRTGTLVWRKDGLDGTVLTGQNGLNFTIAIVQSSDEGIYECYYQGDTDRKQGIMRLIVRGCAENKWGPPSCTGDCPVCYNGGVCDDSRGGCVCPPGFHGQNCENACTNNQIGTSCTRECEGGDCTGQLLCVMDPYGCSCGPGLMGIECNTVCPDGMYGAGCTQTCHCASGGSVCDVMTGVCSSGGCEAGWEGNNCQTACTPGDFGPGCTGTCHCADGGSVCDVMTGVCSSGGCEAGWKGNYCQTACTPGEFGPDCTGTCHCASGGSVCDVMTGVCTGGCVDFWTGDSCQIRTATVSYEDLFTKEEGHFFGDITDHIVAYNNIDADECARRCLQGHGSYDGVNPPCLSFNHRPAGSPEGDSARCWLKSSDKGTAASPGPEWDSWSHRNYYQRKHILAPQDCADMLALGIQYSHVYTIGHPQPFQAYCDMDTAGGGWTVIQRRQDGSVPFDKLWAEYEQGFGNTSGEYWLGLENIHSLTTQKQNELYVYLEDWEMNSRFARYSTFSVGDAGSKYTATIDGYSGDATDSLDPPTTRHSINNRQFSTIDLDNDGSSTDCANTFGQGGWWYTPACFWAMLNGQYLTGCSVPAPPSCSHADGIVWKSWKGYTYSLKKTVMMIRPDNFPVSSFRPCQNGGTLTSGPEDSGLYICACAGGWYGRFCDQECGHCYRNQTCDQYDGTCPTGGSHVCEVGYHGDNCHQECSGTYGPDCGTACGHCYQGQTCDRFNGTCPTGGAHVCAAGYQGESCHQECSVSYGPDCGTTCGHCYQGQTCDSYDGTCPTGGSYVCAAGYHGDNCDQECSGTFGPDCGTSCGHCYQGQTCDRFDGTCPTGGPHVCEAGYNGDNCHQECSGSYDPDCDTTCGHCYQGQTCDRFDGTCPTGGNFVCDAGHHGDNCDQVCSGTYGPDCGTACGYCYRNQTCDRFNGACPTGEAFLCMAGYHGDNCDQECDDGHYGNDCVETCGNCAAGTVCEKTNGRCPGCEDPWVGDTCKMKPTSPPADATVPLITTAASILTSRYIKTTTEPIRNETPTGLSVASIVGGSMAVLLVIVLLTVGTICYRRRNATDRHDTIGREIDLKMVKADDITGKESAENPTCTTLNEECSPYETAIYSIADLVTVDDVVDFLKAKGFDQYSSVFKRHKIDGDAAMCLDSAVLAELIPEIGPRVKLQKMLQELKDNPEPAESYKPLHPDWEIPRSSLTLGKVLGKGQFGEVRLGKLQKRAVTQTVAVKTLKESAGEKDKSDLSGELDILVTVGRHDNIISLVGACTVEGPLTLVVEYAPNGCLKDWLRNNRPKELNQTDIPSSGIQLPMDQLIMFGIDIANGMSHLAAMQCVHRDLAARNVLLGKDMTAKISDFGLSRDIYEESEYVKSTKSQLPIRWIAYESLFYRVYTTQSDVWSFGILLWEIMTMGKQPYGRMTGKELMKLLPTGYRLDKPALCPEDVFDVMKSCWQTLPENRPTFPELKATLDRIIQDYKTYASLLK